MFQGQEDEALQETALVLDSPRYIRELYPDHGLNDRSFEELRWLQLETEHQAALAPPQPTTDADLTLPLATKMVNTAAPLEEAKRVRMLREKLKLELKMGGCNQETPASRGIYYRTAPCHC